MTRLRCSSLNRRGIADFDEFIHKKFPIILRSCLEALYFDPTTTLIEIAVYINVIKHLPLFYDQLTFIIIARHLIIVMDKILTSVHGILRWTTLK